MCRTAHRGRSPGGAGGRHTPHAGERPRRGPEASTHIHGTFSRARKKGPHGPFGFPCSHDTQATPCHFCSQFHAPGTALDPRPRHAQSCLHPHREAVPGTLGPLRLFIRVCRVTQALTWAAAHTRQAPPPLSCLEGCAAVPAGDERTAKPVRERPAARRGSANKARSFDY